MADIISKNLYSKEELDILLKAKQIISSKKRSYLRDIIKADTGYEIIPMSEDLKNYLDKQCKSFIQSFNQNIINNTHSRFGWLVENEFKEFGEFNSPKGAGYPDYELPSDLFKDAPFVENKTFNKTSIESSLRTFYYNSNSKINRTTNHVLVGFEFEEINGLKSLTGNYHIVDLYDKKMRFRLEINCSNIELYE